MKGVEFQYPVAAIHGKPCSHTAQHYVSGDTTTTIITRTVESYDGKVDASRLAPFIQ